MAGGPLDSIVARIEAYFGEFLQTRQQLLDARTRIDAAVSTAQATGSAKIGEKTFTLAQLNALYADNDSLLARNADLQNQIMTFKNQVAAVQEAGTSVMDALVANPDPDYPWYDTPGLMGPEVAVPAAYLIGAGAVLATAIYLFLSNVKSHLANVAGDAGSNLLWYGGSALALYFLAKHKRWL